MSLGDHTSQNALRAPRTTTPRIPPLPATHTAPSMQGNYKGHGSSAWSSLLADTTAVTAPLPAVWQLRVTTTWISLVLEGDFIFVTNLGVDAPQGSALPSLYSGAEAFIPFDSHG